MQFERYSEVLEVLVSAVSARAAEDSTHPLTPAHVDYAAEPFWLSPIACNLASSVSSSYISCAPVLD